MLINIYINQKITYPSEKKYKQTINYSDDIMKSIYSLRPSEYSLEFMYKGPLVYIKMVQSHQQFY